MTAAKITAGNVSDRFNGGITIKSVAYAPGCDFFVKITGGHVVTAESRTANKVIVMKNTRIYNGICYLAVLAGLVACYGCDQKLPPGIPKLNPCTITVNMDGKPVENVTIRLISDKQIHWGCSGITNASGKSTLVTDGKYNGVPAGQYKVLLSRIDTEQREYKGFIEEAKLPPKKQTVIINLKYEDEDETPYEIVITDGQKATLECQVEPPESPDLPKNYGMPKKRNRF